MEFILQGVLYHLDCIYNPIIASVIYPRSYFWPPICHVSLCLSSPMLFLIVIDFSYLYQVFQYTQEYVSYEKSLKAWIA